ncbi:Coiled-coil domain-containing protein [Actinidia chinensis var. chinensis]|uniref:Coiled-coil domain-containing protein n=1 Tax=Actinidia chinensis var. chinensis TaxID=1590841 RepID=A0A2R6QU69_ACTCC|nr:Coiled-coil domain-containing protein [Actinidia chinensis var. chinensis]
MDDSSGDTTSSFDVSSVSCSICLDFVIENGNRSRAKLQCGHEFHLDCIGSAFNMKGAMQCPNCRKVEKGRWLYASGSTFSYPEFIIDDWTPDESSNDFNYSEMPFRVHWCPFSGLARVHSSFEEVESPSTTHHNVQMHHATFADQQTAASPVAHSYVAYFGPIPPTSSNTNESVEDPNSNHSWNGLSGHNQIITAHTFPVIDIHYQSRGHHSHPFPAIGGHVNSADQASVPPATSRSTRGEYDAMTRSGSFMHPFIYGHGGSNPPPHQRIPASHAIHHQRRTPLPVIPAFRRFHGPRPMAAAAASQPDQSGGFFLSPSGLSARNQNETENSNRIPTWERDHMSQLPILSFERDHPNWGSFHHAAGGSDSSNRSGSFWQRH